MDDFEFDGTPPGSSDESSPRKTLTVADKVVEIPKERFEDNFQFKLARQYSKQNPDPGRVFIFNFKEFGDMYSTRKGTDEDVNQLIKTFERLKFNILPQNCYVNLEKKVVENTIVSIVDSIKKNSINSLVCVFLSHGANDDRIVASDGELLSLQDIYKPFCECRALNGIPKFFIIQACKGDEIAKTEKQLKMISSSILSNSPSEDVVIAYASMEGKVSVRNKEEGSWFIQELCANLNKYGDREDVLSILTRTIKFVATDYEYKDYKQVPVIVSTLRKQFYLNLCKPRREMLELCGHIYH